MEAMSEFISESSDEELLLQAIRNGLNTQTTVGTPPLINPGFTNC